jgi:hypothetical protein
MRADHPPPPTLPRRRLAPFMAKALCYHLLEKTHSYLDEMAIFTMGWVSAFLQLIIISRE